MGVFDPDKHDNLLGITDLDELNKMELEGVLDAQQYVLKLETNFTFDSALILNIHRMVFGELYEWAGKWRTIGTNIGIEPGVPFAIIEYADQVNYLRNNSTSSYTIIQTNLHFANLFVDGGRCWSVCNNIARY